MVGIPQILEERCTLRYSVPLPPKVDTFLRLGQAVASLALAVICCIAVSGGMLATTAGACAIGLAGGAILFRVIRGELSLVSTIVNVIQVALGILALTGVVNGVVLGWSALGLEAACLGISVVAIVGGLVGGIVFVGAKATGCLCQSMDNKLKHGEF